ncbi:hypothetical protein ISF_02556 [Cordyceps fumosorosea ARSEF 2679]|uniref:Uncharacterized protein n=1 Tax=Cordyceps fumosorosea (strain ARSEF 2679) TaxID=1081104 RepID=A0A162JL58_CORFA|nr:hypothetical protein ISF_02556 [Cordyceps fumosorosea ARSEF 2679]OAA70582.1 hypothetical protein ISF_02556 [Cordyceps fumosorosea ARSEF 2679]
MPAPGHDDPASVPLDGLHTLNLPLEQQTLPHTSADSRPNSPTRNSASACSSRSSLSRRRSVSSMKGLMPLTLSASAASYTSPILHEENLRQRVDDYLPELLAQDLELASDLFAAKSMSAGAPTYSVVAEYMARAKATGQFTNRLSMALPYQPASARVQVLGAIEERDSIASLLEQQQQEQQYHHHDGYLDGSELDDLSSEDGSFGMPPPPIRYRRNLSIITTATSFTDSVKKQSPQHSPLHMEPVCGSWIDGDSDSDSNSNYDFEDEEDSYAGPESPPTLLPRLYVPQEPLSPLFPRSPTTPHTDLDPLEYEPSATQECSRILHKKSHSVSDVPTATSLMPKKGTASKQAAAAAPDTTPSNRASIIAQEFQRATSPDFSAAEQRTPVSHVLASTPPPVPQKHHQRLSMLSAESLGKQKQTLAAAAVAATARQQPAPIPESPPMTEVDTSSEAGIEEGSAYGDQARSWQPLETDYSRTTPPSSPPRHFVTLANAATPYVPNFGGDELARVVPLPPDVIETLRVSVACFPETILLSSSLTIETIRSYSKKMRHPETDVLRLASTLVPDDEGTGKRSLWSKVNPLKKSSSSSLRHSAMRSINGSRSGSISGVIGGVGGGSADSQKAWSAIQNVFGSCSEYICDALFAHIMAYNYISALLARSAASAPAATTANLLGRHTSCRSRPSTDQKRGDDIPRKAASLLGLGDVDSAGSSSSRFARRTSTMASSIASRPLSTDGLLAGQPISTAAGSGDTPVRTVHAGLYRCIVRLIATARLTSVSGRLDQPIVDEEATEVDPLFMRSLCEVVRLVEETS